MNTDVKGQRPSRLSENETLISFENWKKNLISYLHREHLFLPLLETDACWNKTSDGDSNRGMKDANGLLILDNFLGVIADLSPPLIRQDIMNNTTNLNDVFNLLRTHYKFERFEAIQTLYQLEPSKVIRTPYQLERSEVIRTPCQLERSEVTFMKFSNIKREIVNGKVEKPIELYLRMRQFIIDNLLLSSGRIEHDGNVPTSDEQLSPTTERLIVLRWLEVLHPQLPHRVSNVFSHELRIKSLKDLQPKILVHVDDLLREIEQYTIESDNDASLSNAYITSIPVNDAAKNSSREKDDLMKNEFSIKTCDACKAVREPFIGHTIHRCPNIHAQDRQELLKAFSLDVEEENMESSSSEREETNIPSHESFDNDPCDELQHATRINPLNDSQNDTQNDLQDDHFRSHRRVCIKPSPRINVKIRSTSVSVLVDTGTTGNMVRFSLCTEIGLQILPTPHRATQADGKSKLNVVGEVHTTMLAENNVFFNLDAIVVHNLKAGVIVSGAFLEEHSVIVDIPRRRLVMPDERTVRFEDQSSNPKHQSGIARRLGDPELSLPT